MSGGFTGDGSVKWFVTVDYARPAKTRIKSRGKAGVHHEGVEHTDPGCRFVITIKHPKDKKERDDFLEQLQKAAADTAAAETTLTIPIEDIKSGFKPPTPNQIVVDWQPKATQAPKTATTAARGGAAKAAKYFRRPFDIKF
jgi:hypothetical protein